MTTSNLGKEFLNLKEAAEIMSIHPETVRRWHLREGLKSYKFKNTLRFKKEDLIKFMEQTK